MAQVLLIPLLGPFHLSSPAYNAVTVRDAVAAWEPDALATSALVPGDLDGPGWQDTAEIALPLAVIPWARRRKIPVHPIGEAPAIPDSQEEFARYLEPYPALLARWREIDRALEPVRGLLARPLTATLIREQLLPALRDHALQLEEEFEDGPATAWLRERSGVAVTRLRGLDARRIALLAPAHELPLLEELLGQDPGLELEYAGEPAVTPEARERSLLDVAFRGDVANPDRLLPQLRELDSAEARYHEANLLLAAGHGYEALQLLEKASNGDFSEPYFLPGYLLARLGQLRDLDGQRNAALKAYRAVLALEWVPAEAREAAQQGLERPFEPG